MLRGDVTRVTYTVPLREHFSLPIIFLQFYVTGLYLKRPQDQRMLYPSLICLLTALYTLTWQFAQFVTLLQSFVLFSLAAVSLINKDKVVRVIVAQSISLFVVWCLQFYPRLLLVSLAVTFLPIALLSLKEKLITKNVKIMFTKVVKCLVLYRNLKG